MREILFRGKREDNGEWVYGDFCKPCNIVFVENGYDNVLKQDNIPVCGDYEVIPETVGQYTGTDKNGTKIFEGDIVREKDVIHDGEIQIKGEKYVVEFQKGCWTIRAEDDCWDFLCTQDDLEVIGNIHDNPELSEAANGYKD